MISSDLKFGSFILKPSTSLFDDDLDDNKTNEDHFFNCAIPSRWTKLMLFAVEKYNDDTSLLTFELPSGAQKLNLPLGGYLLVKAPNCEHETQSDAIRPYTSISDQDDETNIGKFTLLVKRYDSWGVKESAQTHFLYTKTNHSYKPPGVVSNYLHHLHVGESVEFKFSCTCVGRLRMDLWPSTINCITLIAVGVGVSPMIQIIRSNVKKYVQFGISFKIVLLYGVRNVKDILMRQLLEFWHLNYPDIFSLVYCVGSRWNNIHMGIKTKDEYLPPSLPENFMSISSGIRECGWIDRDKIKKYAFPPGDNTRVVVCGLPGVYLALCGSRFDEDIDSSSILSQLGYTKDMIIKL